AEGGIGPFVDVVEPPVEAVDVEMIEGPVRRGLAQDELRVAAEDVARAGHDGVALEGPRIILHRAQVELVEGIRSLGAEQRVVQLVRAVVLAEEEPEGVLRIVSAAAISAADAQAAVDLKTLRAVGIDEFDGGVALEGALVPAGVGVDARDVVEEV